MIMNMMNIFVFICLDDLCCSCFLVMSKCLFVNLLVKVGLTRVNVSSTTMASCYCSSCRYIKVKLNVDVGLFGNVFIFCLKILIVFLVCLVIIKYVLSN